MQFYGVFPLRVGIWLISKEKLSGFPWSRRGLCFCTLAHTPEFCSISLHPSLGSRWYLCMLSLQNWSPNANKTHWGMQEKPWKSKSQVKWYSKNLNDVSFLRNICIWISPHQKTILLTVPILLLSEIFYIPSVKSLPAKHTACKHLNHPVSTIWHSVKGF